MSIGNGQSIQPLQRFLRLGQVFAMPLTALIDADAYAAETFVDFLRQYGFKPGSGKDEFGDLRMVSFTYMQPSLDGVPVRRRVDVPLLSLIPLPALSISHADFEFGLQVYGAVEEADKASPGGGSPRSHDPAQHPLAVRIARAPADHIARVNDDKTATAEASTTAEMKVNVRMEQSDLPEGIAQMLAMMSKSTSDEPSSYPSLTISTDDDPVLTDTKKKITLTLSLRNADGTPVSEQQRISLSQDADELLVLPTRAARTNENGIATATVRLAEAPEPGTVLKTITASAIIPASALDDVHGFESIDVVTTLQIRVQGRPTPT